MTNTALQILGIESLPKLFVPNSHAAKRFIEFFTAHIRNPNTRRAYAHAVQEFGAWCMLNGFHELRDIEPVHVAAYIETLQTRLAAPSVKQHLAAIRMLFNWLVVGQVIAVNPASPERVTVVDFLAAGGDSFTAFEGGKNPIGGGIDLDALKIYMRANSPVSPPSTEGIKIFGY